MKSDNFHINNFSNKTNKKFEEIIIISISNTCKLLYVSYIIFKKLYEIIITNIIIYM